MLWKSFYRKTSTKIYLIIFILLFLVFECLLVSRDKFVEKYNRNYKDSFIYLETNDLVTLDNTNIVKVKDCIYYGNVYVLVDQSLKDDEIIVNGSFKQNKLDKYVIVDESSYEFTVKDIYESDSLLFNVYVSQNAFDKLVADKGIKGYYISIKNWNEYEKIVNDLKNTYSGNCYGFNTSVDHVDYEALFANINFYFNLLTIVFVIIFIISIFYIIHEQKNNEYLYRVLGFRKKIIVINRFINISLLYVSSFVISTILVLIISLFI